MRKTLLGAAVVAATSIAATSSEAATNLYHSVQLDFVMSAANQLVQLPYLELEDLDLVEDVAFRWKGAFYGIVLSGCALGQDCSDVGINAVVNQGAGVALTGPYGLNLQVNGLGVSERITEQPVHYAYAESFDRTFHPALAVAAAPFVFFSANYGASSVGPLCGFSPLCLYGQGGGYTRLNYVVTLKDSATETDIQRALRAGFRLSLGGIPEPQTWTLLIAGFGMVGASLRRRTLSASAPSGGRGPSA